VSFLVLVSAACSVVSGKFWAVFSIVTLVPAIAVTTRRLHDVDKSGWMQVIGLIPIVGFIVIIVWLCQAATEPNRCWPAPADGPPAQPS
jgi:uncharacterized membrane protein YhaH (DUF805 family)